MNSSVMTLQKMQNTVRNMIGSHFADNKPNIYASLYELDGDITTLIEAHNRRESEINVTVDQIRSTIIQLARYNEPQIVGLLKGKYGTREMKRRINNEDFDDDDIVLLWKEYKAEVNFDD